MTLKTKDFNGVIVTITTRITMGQKISLENLAIQTGQDMSTHVREALDLVFAKYGIKPSKLIMA